jgi:hypothetical protein
MTVFLVIFGFCLSLAIPRRNTAILCDVADFLGLGEPEDGSESSYNGDNEKSSEVGDNEKSSNGGDDKYSAECLNSDDNGDGRLNGRQ